MVVQEYPTVIVANQEYLKAAGKVRNSTEANIFANFDPILDLLQVWDVHGVKEAAQEYSKHVKNSAMEVQDVQDNVYKASKLLATIC